MDTATLELKSAMASYPVHRALLATRSTFFEGACRNGFREAETGVIDLTEDDPEAVEYMVNYFYHLDYLNKPLSRHSSQRCTRANTPLSSRSARHSAPKKINLALVEDPLLAQALAATNSLPMTPPADELTTQNFNAPSSKMPDTPMADESAADYLTSVQLEPDVDDEKAHLVTHAKVYAIAEKYGIAGLKALARRKFAQEIDLHLNSPEFPEACQEAYETTFHTDRGLRDLIIQTFRANPGLSLRPDIEMAVRETPGLAFELFRMASGLPVAS
ncbi:uncharacterized protein K460DRAFT_80526 [Cucurbitaria berberidis CBS 394.84]|uniref:BTB domain-containing protein n=1 Tax=Cucurbitaria berberidis CBS 394.84 TaxID=1168544 RepID=A0A9P4LAT3_9PLEO|nr:uncharacterized protein K460DRAFT_80526 [Cucurbitaria berberidis CBS 394.84]KAF1848751.1 hypothetical protein K460DRAFT_80526 [Cucurbitaria berberidis CBS 394.84]